MTRIVHFTRMFGLLGLTCLVLAAAAIPATAQQSYTWNGGSAGTWSDGLSGWLNGTSSVSWSYTTSTDALFTGTAPTSVTVSAVTAYGIQFTTGNYVLNGGTITLADPSSVGGTAGVISVGSAFSDTINSVIAGSVGLTMTGGGTLVVAGLNTYTGATVVSNGALTAGVASRVGIGGAFANNSAITIANVAGATLNLAGFSNQIGSLTGGGTTGGNITLGAATLTVGADNTSPGAYAGVISGAGGALTKVGSGTLTLAGANTYTGATTLKAGTLALSFGAVSANILPSASTLNLGSGTLQLSGAGTQAVNGLSTTADALSNIVLSANETLTLGALTSAGAGSTLNFNTVAGGANATSSTVGTGIIVLTGQTAGSPINYGFTVTDTGGFGLATVNASNQVIRLTTTALLPATGATSANDYRIDNNAGGASAVGSSTLAITTSESAKSITVDTAAASGVLTLNSGVVLSNNTWIFGGAGSNTYQVTGSAGGAGLKAVASGNTITINNYNAGAITISSPILANGNSSVSVFGTGTLILAGANTYSGGTTVSGGTVQVPSGGSITHPSASMTVGNNSGDNGMLNITGGAVSSFSGFLGDNAGSSGTATVNGGTWTTGSGYLYVGYGGIGSLNIAGGAMSNVNGLLGVTSGSSGTATLSSGSWTSSGTLYVGFTGVGALSVSGGAISSASSYIGNNAGSSGSATVSGGAWANSGALIVGNSGAGTLNITGAGVVAVGATGTGTLILGVLPGSNGTLNLGTGSAAGMLYAGVVTAGGGTAVVNFNETGGYNFAPQLSGSLALNKLGAGTTILTAANFYTGATTVSAGQLVADNAGALNPVGGGAVSVAAGAGLGYAAVADAPLGLSSTLAITGGAGTAIAGSIGSTAASAAINVAGAATISNAAHTVNIYGIAGVTPLAGTNTYTLLQGGSGSSLNPTTAATLGTVYNNTNFTVGALTATAATLQVAVTSITPLTSAYWIGGLSGAANVWAASNGSTASNWAATPGGSVQALIPGPGASVTISAASPIAAPTATVLGANMSIAGLTIADTVNGLGLNPDGFALTIGAAGIAMNAGVPASSIGNVVLGASQVWTNNSANALTVSGTVSGAAANTLTKTGPGALILSGLNTYTGATIVNAGALTAGVASIPGIGGAFGNNSAITMGNVAGAALNLAGFNTQIGSLTGGGTTGGNINLGAATLTVGADNTSQAAYAGVISGTGGALTKIGAGMLTLAGANTYTGATTINGGALALGFGTVSANILPSASALTLGGGTLQLTGTGTQTVNGLATAASTVNSILVNANETLTLGALTSSGLNSSLNFNTAAGGANAATSTIGTGIIVLNGQTTGTPINYGFTVTDAGGFGLAAINAANQVIRLTTTALLPANGATSANDYRIDNNTGGASAAGSSTLAITASESAKSITVDTSAASGVLTLSSGRVLSSNTWVFGGTGANTHQITGSASGAGLKAVASGNAVTINNYNTGAVTIGSPILDNGGTLVSVFGTGTLILSGVNTYSGGTTISGGTVQVPSGGSITNASANMIVGNNSGDSGTLSISGGAVSSSSGFLGNNAGSSGTATVSNGTWTNGTVYVGNSGAGVLNVTGGTISSASSYFGNSAGSSGTATVSNGIWTNSGTLYVGNFGVGVLNVTGGAISSTSGYLGSNPGSSGTATVSGGTLTNSGVLYVGNSGVGVLNVTGGAVVIVGVSGAGTLAIGYTATGNGTLNLGTGGAAGMLYAGVVTGGGGTAVVNFNETGGYAFAPQLIGTLSVNQLSSGTTILTAANSYMGPTTVSAGQLLAANAAALNPASGGAVTVAAGAALGYAAVADAPMGIHSTLAITGGAGTVIGASIGSTATSAELNVAGAATINGTYAVNIYGIAGVTPLAGTNSYTLLQGGPGSSLNPPAPATLGIVFNNTNFTVGAVTATASTVQVTVTGAAPLTNAYWVGGLSAAPNVWAASDGSTASNWAATSASAAQALVPGPSAIVTISATSPITAPVATVLGANISIAGLTIADTVNGLGLNADGFALNVGAGGITMSAGVPASTIAANVVLGAGQAWTNNSTNALTVSGTVSGPAGSALTKTGPGALILSGLNTYTGATIVSSGAVTAGVASMAGIGGPLGINSAITLANVAGATLNLAGFNIQIGSLTGGGTTGGNIALGAATLTVGGDNTSPAAYAGIISGAGGALTKIGAGTLTLAGANTYTGATTISGGTLALTFGTISTNILPSASTLTLGGGTLQLTGIGTQTVNGLTAAASTVSNILLGANETLTLGALTSVGANSPLNFNTAGSGANGATVGTGIILLTGQTSGTPINYGFTVTDAGGFGLATVNASNQVIRLTTTALLPATGATSANDYRIDNNAGGASAAGSHALTVTASESAKSITVDTTAASGVLTLNSGRVLSNNTWIFGGTGANAYQISGSAGGAGLKAVASGNAITINNYNTGVVTISSPILDNGGNLVSVFGTGTLILAGANTYTGATTVSGGTLQVPSGGSITRISGNTTVGNNNGDNGALSITGGAVSDSSGYLGNNAGSTGTATISSGNWSNFNSLYVGYFGAGVLNVTGGAASSQNGNYLGYNAGSSGTATVSGGTWSTNSSLTVGNSGAGALNVVGGTVSSTSAYLGYNAGSSGTATVSSGTWTGNGIGYLYVGYSGVGVLNITGGAVSIPYSYLGYNAGSSGTVTASGGTWTSGTNLYVGYSGVGALNLTGGAVSSQNDNVLGYNLGSSGTVTVNSGTWTNGILYVGNSGIGLLNIAGGAVSDTSAYLGNNAGSTGTATVNGRTWTNSNLLYVGNSGVGVLNVTGGAVSSQNGSVLGYNAGSSGTATVSGGTWTNGSFLYVGYSGVGLLNVTGGAASSPNGYVGYNSGSSGTATVSSGTWSNSNSLYVGYSGAGTLSVTGGAISDLIGYIGYGSNGGATISGGTWTSNSSLYVGNFGVGVLNVTGGAVSSAIGYLGYNSGSSGMAMVSGGTWTNSNNLYIGYYGVGVLNLTSAGVIAGSGTLTLGANAGSNGTLNLGAGGAAGLLQGGTVTGGTGTAVVDFNQSGGYTFAAQLSGPLVVNKLGVGTTILTAANSYTGATAVYTGQLLAANSSALNPSSGGAVTVAAGAGLGYAAVADAPLGLSSTLTITGGAGTVIGGSIGSSAASAAINVAGAATISNGPHAVNIYGITGVTPLAGTNTYTLLQGGPGSLLNPATAATLGTVYNNTNFTIGAVMASASTIQVTVTSATPLMSAYWVGGLSRAANVWAASNGSAASNWAATVGGAVQALVPGAGASVTISAASPIAAPAATVLGANMSVAGLTIADTVNGLGLNADGFALTVGAGGITMNTGVPASTIGNVVLGASQVWTNNSANALAVSGTVSGPAGNALTKTGPGALILSGLNTYSGATIVSNGALTAGVASQVGIGGAFGNNSAITLGNVAGATLNLAGFNTQVGSLTGGGTTGGNVTLGGGP